jgi:hypothetical protein
MRDRLIELLKMVEYQYTETHSIMTQNVADFLLQRGVIVPPCKVGDTVYCIIKGFSGVMRGRVCSFILTDKKTTIHCAIDGYFGQDFPYCEFGKTVFLTKEEAEQALKGGEG